MAGAMTPATYRRSWPINPEVAKNDLVSVLDVLDVPDVLVELRGALIFVGTS